jgi:hypothetical protein
MKQKRIGPARKGGAGDVFTPANAHTATKNKPKSQSVSDAPTYLIGSPTVKFERPGVSHGQG